MDNNFWKDKRVLITGHTGFKGSWLTIILKKFGANVIGFSKDIPTKPSLFEIAEVKNNIQNIIGNVNNRDQIEQAFNEFKPEIVFHMAAQSIVRESYKKPLETFSTNVLGTANVLEAVRNSNYVKVVIVVTSDKSYKVKKDHSKYSEDDPMGGYDPYSSSKGCAELLTSSYRNSFFNPSKFDEHNVALASVRAGNVVGGGDWGMDRLLPDIIRGILNKSKVAIRNPGSTRPWQFVLDPLFGYLRLAEKMWQSKGEFSEGWNFGPTSEEEHTVKWITENIKKQFKDKINFEINSSNQPHEEKYLRLDCSKAEKELLWTSKMKLETTLKWTLNWYEEYMKNSDMREFTERQIDEFILMENELT
ncbi:CDP-glucose 4,6-dehydratase [Nitrosopumilus sp.]|uniref:CDP-glucose 4,6-dehydratase n=1 Tax=Nitrosopumilus sp. TaxID=2024843 RepID=UPI0026037220|nr:CDP-glucose 4,6-dehydratase [Nitrosopumilus sp.]